MLKYDDYAKSLNLLFPCGTQNIPGELVDINYVVGGSFVYLESENQQTVTF